MAFADLDLHVVLAGNLRRMGYRRPRPIQDRAIPPALAGGDVIGIARTGKGKTLAFLVPVIETLLRAPAEPPGPGRVRALVLAPTRELVAQTAETAADLVQGGHVKAVAVHGNAAASRQAEAIARGCDVLVGTPARVRELVEAGAVSLARIDTVVLDEVDRMLDMGFRPQVEQLLARLPERRRTLLFSATLPDEVDELVARYLREPERVEVDPEGTPVEHVRQRVIEIHDRDKLAFLLQRHATGAARGMLVFCGTRRRTGWVGAALARHGVKVGMLHGDRSSAQRTSALEGFRDGAIEVLVATDVAARGLHVEAVRTVVNYDVPPQPEDYVHRVGRAGHGGGSGTAWTLVSIVDRPKWARLAERLDPDVEVMQPGELEGFAPTVPIRSSGSPVLAMLERRMRAAEGAGAGGSAERGGRDVRGRRGKLKRGRETRGKGARRMRPGGGSGKASRPIKPGQRPGGGVRRPGDGGGPGDAPGDGNGRKGSS